MDNNFNSFNPASGADSASVQEQLVKGSLSSSNFNIVDELEEVDLGKRLAQLIQFQYR